VERPDPSTFESVAEQRLRARQEGRPFVAPSKPQAAPVRARSTEALLKAVRIAEAGASAAGEADTGSPLRPRAKSTHAFGPGSPDGSGKKLSPVTDAGEARRQLLMKRSQSADQNVSEAAATPESAAPATAPPEPPGSPPNCGVRVPAK